MEWLSQTADLPARECYKVLIFQQASGLIDTLITHTLI